MNDPEPKSPEPAETARCEYCGKTRPVTELETATIYRNGQQIEGLYCRDEGCAYSEQCSAEG